MRKPHQENAVLLMRSEGIVEKIFDPNNPTSMGEVLTDIMREEKQVQRARQRTHKLPRMLLRRCAPSPTSAHHWVYPPQGQRGRPVCKHCERRGK